VSDIACIPEETMTAAAAPVPADFYGSIPPFSRFSELSDARHYRPVPADWSVVIADVIDSTGAIAVGRYRDVNRIGAAAIVCARKGMRQQDFPYVFGGDGATLLLPPARVDAVLSELAGLQKLAASRFGFTLRIGSVPVRTLRDRGARLEVARFRIAQDKCIGLLRGGGVDEAERLLKTDGMDEPGCTTPAAVPDLDDLSCRWKSVPSSRGRVISLLIVARGAYPSALYRSILRDLEQIVDHGLDAANPIQRERLQYRGWWECIRDEARHYPSIWSSGYLRKCLGILVAVATLKYRLPAFFYDPAAYSASVPVHSDYRKFDDALRMIIDCHPAQVERLKTYLELRYRNGDLCYGLHESAESLITCFVQSTAPGQHIHFVDGGDGGYAVAAQQLKAQLAAGRDTCTAVT